MRVLVIHNPSSGSESWSEETLRRLFLDAGHEVGYRSLKEAGWSEGLHQVADAIVAVGGDGTVRQVAIAVSGGTLELPMAILPAGTANNLARHMGIEGPASRIASGLATARPARVAIGLVSGQGSPSVRFVESAGVGAFTQMLQKADNTGTATMAEGLKLLRAAVEKAQPQVVRLEADGTDLSGEYIMVEAMNVGSIGPRLVLAPQADHSDEHLDLVLVHPGERKALIDYLDALESGGTASFPFVPLRVRRIQLSWKRGHVDDTPWPPRALRSERAGEMTVEVDRHLSLLIP